MVTECKYTTRYNFHLRGKNSVRTKGNKNYFQSERRAMHECTILKETAH